MMADVELNRLIDDAVTVGDCRNEGAFWTRREEIFLKEKRVEEGGANRRRRGTAQPLC